MKLKERHDFVLYCAIALFAVIMLVFEFTRTGDFKIFVNAGSLLMDERNLYVYNEYSEFKYWYSPLFALMLAPFKGMPVLVPILIWKVLNLFFLYRIWKIIDGRYIDDTLFTQKTKRTFQILSWVLGFYLIFNTTHTVQMSLFIIYSVLESIDLIQSRKKPLLGAALLALAINIKIMPIVAVPYLLYRKEFKGTIYCIILWVAMLYLPAIFIGFEYNDFLLSEWWKAVNPTQREHMLDVKEKGFHSLSALFTALFTETKGNSYVLDIKRNILLLEDQTVFVIINGSRLLLVSLMLWVLNTMPFLKAKSKTHEFWEISYLLLITPLIFPHQQVYGFTLAWPAVIYTLYYFMMRRKEQGLQLWDYLWMFTLLLINLELLLGFLRDILWHYKTLTYGILMLTFLLIAANPSKNKALTKAEE